jgi:hypothetical protein
MISNTLGMLGSEPQKFLIARITIIMSYSMGIYGYLLV